ncbi:FtsQ-type POTRA domain-containing protein [Cohnella endophytica]|uniref:FtsQ-type POTRA domain-containing protein n=1 Tax=Cohnella endophytica TaxID=2419778 RepID=A0A494Y1L5_9BACL|nr:FtsQ-type POTRA domain-containing protein [Cohnella endophytica]RKP55273.1 FtsQ-type POTRA domain-containing protein [Cohnella endophytica]
MADRIPALKRDGAIPRTRRNKRLLTILVALVAIVLVALFFRSPLSKISEIQVTGTTFLTHEEVTGELGVAVGDSFFFPSIGKLKARMAGLKPVQSLTIIKNFPGVLRVEVKEYPQVAIQLAPDGKVSAVLANGVVLPLPEGKMLDKPILSDWKSDDPNLAALCTALSGLPSYLLADLSEIHPDPSTAYPNRIKLFTRSRFEVVTTIDFLPDKISYLSDIVQNREPGKIIMLEADSYLPYSAENVTDGAQAADKVKEKDSTQ